MPILFCMASILCQKQTYAFCTSLDNLLFQSVLEAMWLSAHVSLGYRNLRYLFDSQLLELLIYRPNHMLLLYIAYCSEARGIFSRWHMLC
jgi:hypothetical protein